MSHCKCCHRKLQCLHCHNKKLTARKCPICFDIKPFKTLGHYTRHMKLKHGAPDRLALKSLTFTGPSEDRNSQKCHSNSPSSEKLNVIRSTRAYVYDSEKAWKRHLRRNCNEECLNPFKRSNPFNETPYPKPPSFPRPLTLNFNGGMASSLSKSEELSAWLEHDTEVEEIRIQNEYNRMVWEDMIIQLHKDDWVSKRSA